MGKLVKYCSVCEEGFAERFGFCPNCGGQLEAFEMNPIAKEAETVVDANAERFAQTLESAPKWSEISQTEEVATIVPETMDFSADSDILELEAVDTREEIVEEEIVETEPEVFAPTVAAIGSSANEYQQANFADEAESNFSDNNAKRENFDNGYHITVVSEEASSWFRPFLLSLMAFAFLAAISSYAIAIWIHGFQIPEIDGVNDVLYSSLTEETPLAIEEKEKKNDKKGGGGGGGGNENPDPASRGRIPTNGNPTPLMIVPRFDSDIQINNRVQSNIKKEDDGQVIGGGNADGVSSGKGKGGGIGTGIGTGIGSGEGTGIGSGRGSGSGNGLGDGNGDGIGDGDRENERTRVVPQIAKVEKVQPVGVSKGVTITSKPRANYTDAARQNNVQGTVNLRVTFNANGTIGSVTPVSSLPNGLTEQAISAAKQIRFEPAMKNGQPQSVTKVVQYSFTIY